VHGSRCHWSRRVADLSLSRPLPAEAEAAAAQSYRVLARASEAAGLPRRAMTAPEL